MTYLQLAEQVSQQDVIEWVGLGSGMLYVVLATYEKPSCWWFGILSSGCIAWKSFTDYHLIADALLQLFYIAMGIYGLWQWMKGRDANQPKPVITTPWLYHIVLVVGCGLVSWPLSWMLIHYADARYGFADTWLTTLSVVATFLLIRKDLHNWIYWIVIDLVYLVLYWKTEGYLFALLFFMYAVISVYGFRQWSLSLQRHRTARD